MHHENDDHAKHFTPQRPELIHLTRSARGDLLVTSSSSSDPSRSFEPFVLPRIPLSLHCWLTGLGNEFRRRHERCIAALLVLHCHQRRWLSPVIPSQTCSQEGSAWTLDIGTDRLPDNHRIGGSFQIRVARDVVDAVETVPKFDGFHIVQTLVDKWSMAYCFLNAAGETGVLPVEEAIEDDWAFALADALPRMTVE